MDREKAIGLFRLHLNDPFAPFTRYGLDIAIPQAKEAIINLALQLHEDMLPEELHKERLLMKAEILKVFQEEINKAKTETENNEIQPD